MSLLSFEFRIVTLELRFGSLLPDEVVVITLSHDGALVIREALCLLSCCKLAIVT